MSHIFSLVLSFFSSVNGVPIPVPESSSSSRVLKGWQVCLPNMASRVLVSAIRAMFLLSWCRVLLSRWPLFSHSDSQKAKDGTLLRKIEPCASAHWAARRSRRPAPWLRLGRIQASFQGQIPADAQTLQALMSFQLPALSATCFSSPTKQAQGPHLPDFEGPRMCSRSLLISLTSRLGS